MGSVATARATKRAAYAVMLVFAYVFIASDVRAADVISFSPGPDFTIRIDTPWGEYLVDQVGNNTVWVGTEAEYFDAKVRAIAAQRQFREIRPREFIDAQLPSLSLGIEEVAGISSAIALTPARIPHAPPARHGFHYVMLSWSASGNQGLTVRLEDVAHRRTFAPFSCFRDSVPRCLWQLHDSELGIPLVAIFITRGQKPGAATLPSLAYLDYQANRDTSPLDAADLSQLHRFDARIPLSP